jgi:hypothetical protein
MAGKGLIWHKIGTGWLLKKSIPPPMGDSGPIEKVGLNGY